MDGRLPLLAEQLLLIERELRALGWWEQVPPSAQALASTQPFSIDTLSFEQWLQWVMLPRMKLLIEAEQPLPTVSGIHDMAEEVYRGRERQVAPLLQALAAFDRLLSS